MIVQMGSCGWGMDGGVRGWGVDSGLWLGHGRGAMAGFRTGEVVPVQRGHQLTAVDEV